MFEDDFPFSTDLLFTLAFTILCETWTIKRLTNDQNERPST